VGPRSLLLAGARAAAALPAAVPAAVLVAVLAAGCSGSDTPDPVPSPSPTRTATESPVADDCPPIEGAQQTVTIPRGATAPLPDGGRIQLQDVTGDSAGLLVVRQTQGCEGQSRLDVPQGSEITARGVRIEVVSVDAGTGGMPPTVQLRFGPPT
jgi:hypothetical protein